MEIFILSSIESVKIRIIWGDSFHYRGPEDSSNISNWFPVMIFLAWHQFGALEILNNRRSLRGRIGYDAKKRFLQNYPHFRLKWLFHVKAAVSVTLEFRKRFFQSLHFSLWLFQQRQGEVRKTGRTKEVVGFIPRFDSTMAGFSGARSQWQCCPALTHWRREL